jgi:hypothetical protein
MNMPVGTHETNEMQAVPVEGHEDKDDPSETVEKHLINANYAKGRRAFS